MKHHAKKQVFIQLNSRDFEILKFIASEGPKTSSELSRKFWNDKSNKAHAGLHRVRKLIDGGLFIFGNPRLLYLSETAKELLLKRSGVEELKANGQSSS